MRFQRRRSVTQVAFIIVGKLEGVYLYDMSDEPETRKERHWWLDTEVLSAIL